MVVLYNYINASAHACNTAMTLHAASRLSINIPYFPTLFPHVLCFEL